MNNLCFEQLKYIILLNIIYTQVKSLKAHQHTKYTPNIYVYIHVYKIGTYTYTYSVHTELNVCAIIENMKYCYHPQPQDMHIILNNIYITDVSIPKYLI